MRYLILAKFFSLVWVAFFAVVSFIAVKRLDKPTLTQAERNRLKLYVILLTAFSAVYGHIQGQGIEEKLEKTASAIPEIQTDLRGIGNKVKDIPNIREWMAFRLQEASAKGHPAREPRDGSWELVAGSVQLESRDLPREVLVFKEAAQEDNSDVRQIQLAHAYITAKRYTLARQVFESVVQTSNDYLNTEIAALMAKALRAGLGDKLANKELGLAWVLHWDEEPHYKVTAHLSDDKTHWVAIPLEPSSPAGSVIKHPLKQFIRISAEPFTRGEGQPILYHNTIMLSMGLVDRNYKLSHPLLLTKPQRIP